MARLAVFRKGQEANILWGRWGVGGKEGELLGGDCWRSGDS